MAKRRNLPGTHRVRIGNTQVINNGRHRSRLSDPYHLVLTLTWPRFFLGLAACFLLANLFFGTIFWLLPGSVANVPDDALLEYFFFSIETLATVGYGSMSPASIAGHLVASVEILTGMVGVALTTGLVFARFSKPTAKFLFSDRVLMRRFEGREVLMLRVANERYNRIIGASAKLSLVREETSAEGDSYFRIHDLPLVREATQVFALTWTLMHVIDERSALRGMSPDELERRRARILVSVTGHDETMAAEVRAVSEYEAGDIAMGGRFADVLKIGPDGERIVDLTRFHDIELGPLELGVAAD